MSLSAIFLDKDIIIDSSTCIVYKEAEEAIQQLSQANFFFVVFSHQESIAVRMKLYETIGRLSGSLLDFYYPSMIEKAVQEHNVDVSSSWLIGDMLDDIQVGNRIGIRSVLLDNGHEKNWSRGLFRSPFMRVSSFLEAAEYILVKRAQLQIQA